MDQKQAGETIVAGAWQSACASWAMGPASKLYDSMTAQVEVDGE